LRFTLSNNGHSRPGKTRASLSQRLENART
jgi:hypothetical protein